MTARPAHHTVDVYGAEVYCATNARQWAWLRRRFDFVEDLPTSAGQAQFAVWEPNSGLSVPHLILWVDVAKHHGEGELIDSCAHEASHAASELFNHIGHTPTGTDEPTAYFVGWLTRWIWEHCRKDSDA